ncbi:MAG: hypothetical protein ACPGXL_02115 [Chitinophagales bacterium]
MIKNKQNHSVYWVFTLLLATSSLFFACQNTNEPSKQKPPTKIKTSDVPSLGKADNFTIVGSKSIGAITATTNEASLIQIYGSQNVKRDSLHVGEGLYTPSTVVFPDSPKELNIAWKEGKVFEEIARIVIRRPESIWATQEGITMGSSLTDVVKANEVDFTLYGFEWDYSGSVASWEGGVLDTKKMGVRFSPTANEAYNNITSEERAQIMGDIEVASNNPVLAKLEVKAIQLFFYF